MKKTLCLFAALVLFGVSGLAAGENETTIPNRLATAKVGEWALYRVPGGYTQKHMVVERDSDGADAHVTIRIQDILDGKIVKTHEMVEVAGEPMAPMPPPKDEGATAAVRTETVKVKGKEYDATAIDVKKGDALLRTWYIVPELPVYGLAKRVSPDQATDFEIIDFGGAE